MSSSIRSRSNHSVITPEFLKHDAGSSGRDQYKSVSRWARKHFQRSWSLLKQLCGSS